MARRGEKVGWKWRFKIMFFLLFFICLIILGSNISAKRLAIITNQEINPPFYMKRMNNDVVQLDFMGNQFDYSLLPIRNKYSNVKASIQNSWVTVKCNLALRVEYMHYLWLKGVKQLRHDTDNFFAE